MSRPELDAVLRRLPWVAIGKARMSDRGRYYHRQRAILLRCGMSRVAWECSAMHEAIHAERGDTPGATPWHERKTERLVDAEAARRLIPLDALLDAHLWSRHPAEVAEELHVDLDTLKVRVKNLTQDEKDYINGRLAERGNVA